MNMANNHLVQAARAVERKPRAIFLVLQVVGLVVLFFAGLVPLSLLAAPLAGGIARLANPLLKEALNFGLLSLALSFGALIFAVLLWVRLVEKRPFSGIGLWGGNKLRRYAMGFGYGFLSMTATAAMLLVIGGGQVDNSYLSVAGLQAFPYIVIVLFGWIIQGAAEEVIIQGWLMPKAAKTFGLVLGVAISTAVFAGLHLGNSGVAFLPLFNLCLYGLFAASYALYEEGIIGVCGFHAAWNFSQGNIFGFLVSGGAAQGGSVIGISTESSNVLNGGAFGPEGGLIVTLVLVVALLVMVKLHKAKASRQESSQMS